MQRRGNENMMLGGMGKLSGSGGGQMMSMGNVLQASNRNNTFAGEWYHTSCPSLHQLN
jgi:hypothetical protein